MCIYYTDYLRKIDDQYYLDSIIRIFFTAYVTLSNLSKEDDNGITIIPAC